MNLRPYAYSVAALSKRLRWQVFRAFFSVELRRNFSLFLELSGINAEGCGIAFRLSFGARGCFFRTFGVAYVKLLEEIHSTGHSSTEKAILVTDLGVVLVPLWNLFSVLVVHMLCFPLSE